MITVLVKDYHIMRRSLGFGVERLRWFLRDFVRFIGRIEHRGPITVDLAAPWALSSHSSDPARAERRLWAVRQFARHLAAFGPATEIPGRGGSAALGATTKHHIYSDAEITALLQECGRLRSRGRPRSRTHVASFSLRASTGLRVSEARRLHRHDVDLCKGLLTFHEGKFRKSRAVPLWKTPAAQLRAWLSHIDPSPVAPVFPAPDRLLAFLEDL
jgi:integrase